MRRRGYLSALNLLLPGVAHCYYGRWRRGLVLVLGEALVQAACCEILIHLPRGNLATVLVVLAGYRIGAVVDAFRLARRSPAPPRLPRLVALPLALVAYPLVLYPALFGLSRTVFDVFSVPIRSMQDTVLEGDRLVADRLAYLFRDPRRGEIVAHRVVYEGEPRTWLQRVIGLPGDRVEVRGHRAIVNGAPLHEPYARIATDGTGEFGPVTVPENSYFVLGDNRPNSMDSRQRGYVAREAIFARAGAVTESYDPETGAMRWSRIGTVLR